jgi:hypothetical protein
MANKFMKHTDNPNSRLTIGKDRTTYRARFGYTIMN